MTETKRELTFKHNQTIGRHGWLRLTPAYSVKLVQQIIDKHPEITYVLDPFSGTGTTGLVCAENGIRCDLLDINPFLVWFARVKTKNYSQDVLNNARESVREISDRVRTNYRLDNLWFPPISNITRWWAEDDLIFLSNIYAQIVAHFFQQPDTVDLVLIAFCRLVIELSNAAFNHQSMSFHDISVGTRRTETQREQFLSRFLQITDNVLDSARFTIGSTVRVKNADARSVPIPEDNLYDAVITSPPYPNRMSYIRELRPYMYWLRYITDAREAGELDWLAIGGTWGIATSRVAGWKPNEHDIDYADLRRVVEQISNNSDLLARYVQKYFVDIFHHLQTLYPALRDGAKVFYVVGNSKFYDALVPVERIYAHLLEQVGFANITTEIIRKRNSKKELFEFCISGNKPTRLA